MVQADGPGAAWQPPFTVGEQFSQSLVFDRDSIRQYAAMAMDPNPVHLDDDVAARSRFGGLIACGAHSTGWMMGLLGIFVVARSASLGLELNFSLRRAVPAGQEAVGTWLVTSLQHKPSLRGHIMALNGSLMDSAGALLLSATAKVLLLPSFDSPAAIAQ